MKKHLLFILLALLSVLVSFGQGTIRGKITDDKGETLIGVTVVLKSNKAIGISTDFDGNFSLKIPESTPQILVISYLSYKTIEETVQLSTDQVLVKNFVMISSAQALGEVQIVAKAVRSKDYYVEQIKKNSATTIDYISSETMKKTGDNNVTAAVTRVSGVSTNGAFITVRGLGDRYVKTSINGSRIPTLDPFTNNIKLDLFPASLVDNIIITKTASADLPGDWAGAYISIETKDYPEQLSLNVESSFGFNSQSTFKNIVSTQHSKTDLLGFDTGLRDRDHNDFNSPNLFPNQYQQFVAIGLAPYFNSIGVTGNTPWNNYYFKLGLVQLGLLAPALINDNVAYTDAKNKYTTGDYTNQAFNKINSSASKTGQSFPNSWNTKLRNAPLDFSQSFSLGNQTTLFGKQLGYIIGLRYYSSIINDPNAEAQRIYPETYFTLSDEKRQNTRETSGWSALCNIAYKLNTNNSVSFLFMPNFVGVNNVKNGFEIKNANITLTQFYEQRRQLVYQFKSEHYIPRNKIKIESNASFTNGKSTAPDFRNIVYAGDGTSTIAIDPTNQPADRYFRYLKDNLFDSRISAEFPIGNKPDLPRKFKFGGSYQHDQQKFDQYHYYFRRGNSVAAPQSTNLDEILSLNNFAINNNTIDWVYFQDVLPINHSIGRSNLTSGFIMLDYTIFPRLRISGGLRVEKSHIYTDIFLFDSIGYIKDDIRRNYAQGQPNANPGEINKASILPSANIIYKIKNNEDSPVNLRFNFSQTVARPSIRELSGAVIYDYELQANVQGNPDLKMVQVNNYDLRLESYFKNNDNVSLSLFNKDFRNHIELEYSDVYTWGNVDNSNVKGIEIDGRKIITSHLELNANITFANSKSTFVRTRKQTVGTTTTIFYEDTVKRQMFGQAPYVINGILSYSFKHPDLILTLSYNVQGPRLVISSNVSSIPDIYELPRQLFDFKATKKISKHFSASITVKNILNSPIQRSYKTPVEYKLYDKYTYGTGYLLSISYKL